MYALVDFIKEKAADGTTPCEFVPMSWVTEDMQKCSFPKIKAYTKAFKHCLMPNPNWKRSAVNIAYVSSNLDAVKVYRDEVIKNGSGVSAVESEPENGSAMPTKAINSLLKAIPPNFSDSETSETEVRSSTKNMK
ncbi:unnamed protein product, partial [Allacma fusca]